MTEEPNQSQEKKLPPSLIVDEDSPDFGVYPLMDDSTIVGRSPETDIQLIHDPTISRQHFTVKKLNEKFMIRDLKSANGTFVNGKKISEVELQDNDEIMIE